MKSDQVGFEPHFERSKWLGSPGPLGASPCTAFINIWKALAAGNGCSIAIGDPTSENRHL